MPRSTGKRSSSFRYLEHTDVAATEFWEWTGIVAALGETWTATEFHVRRAEVDYLKPFIWGDTVRVYVRIDRIGTTSMTQRYEMVDDSTGDLHCAVDMVIVNVHLPTGKPAPIADAVRDFIEKLPS
jgi:acyl-CoA thioesterase FadM